MSRSIIGIPQEAENYKYFEQAGRNRNENGTSCNILLKLVRNRTFDFTLVESSGNLLSHFLPKRSSGCGEILCMQVFHNMRMLHEVPFSHI